MKITSLNQIPDSTLDIMLLKYRQKFNYLGGIGMSTRKDGLVSVYSNKGKMLFDDQGNEV